MKDYKLIICSTYKSDTAMSPSNKQVCAADRYNLLVCLYSTANIKAVGSAIEVDNLVAP